MASPKIFMCKRGFTLTELLIVVSIITLLAGLTLFVDLNSYRGDAFRAEVSSFGGALQTARADALNNINQARHGVAIHPDGCDGYVIFEGNDYAAANRALDVCIKASYGGVTISPSSEVVFDQLSGNALTNTGSNYDGVITLTDPNRNMTATISINHEGKISW